MTNDEQDGKGCGDLAGDNATGNNANGVGVFDPVLSNEECLNERLQDVADDLDRANDAVEQSNQALLKAWEERDELKRECERKVAGRFLTRAGAVVGLGLAAVLTVTNMYQVHQNKLLENELSAVRAEVHKTYGTRDNAVQALDAAEAVMKGLHATISAKRAENTKLAEKAAFKPYALAVEDWYDITDVGERANGKPLWVRMSYGPLVSKNQKVVVGLKQIDDALVANSRAVLPARGAGQDVFLEITEVGMPADIDDIIARSTPARIMVKIDAAKLAQKKTVLVPEMYASGKTVYRVPHDVVTTMAKEW